ncbi:translocation/assembly module TamB domain-containing protein [Aureimonas sp. SK2]|uniref:translocation/assembly module TamB domain-containing protein n=1 Tax=Aureimonas sp. SK2 TaxID=3015992 RepID=UPI002443913C|nr:translocation/assembly module TamB domain-containing protein [Aureimonas sp. SK2]
MIAMRLLSALLLKLRLAALVAATLLAAQPAHAQFLAGQLESLLSTEDRQVKIQGLSGAFSGEVRIEEVTVSDRDGVWLTLRDLALDWSPLALVRKTVEVENLTAGQIVMDRLPRAAPPTTEESTEPFSLPSITARINRISIAEFVLGEAVAGIPARLAADATLNLQPDPTQLDAAATIRRLDQGGDIALKVGFQPSANRLEIAINASEPAGGIVAGLLKLPGTPPVRLSVNGTGPFDDFAADGTLDLGSERAATLRATVQNGAEGRRIGVDLTALSAPFVPLAYQGVVGENLALAANVLLRPDGVIGIDAGRLQSGPLDLSATGTFDRTGAGNDLTVALRTDAANPVPLAFGSQGARTALEISSIDASLQGSLSAAALRIAAAARTAGFEDYVANAVTLNASSTGFDLNNLVGPVVVDLDAQSASVPDGIATRVLEGPIALDADGALTAEGLAFNTARLTTGAANLALSGSAALNFSTFQLRIDSDFETAALSADAVPYVGERVAIAGDVRRAADGSFGVDNLRVDGDALDLSGSASLTGEEIAAAITGQLNQAAIADSALNGQAQFDLRASGTTSAPAIDLTATASNLEVVGRQLTDLQARIQGTFAPQAPSGTVALNGTFDGAPLALSADLATEGDVRRLNNLLLRQGENRIEGAVALDGENRATGALNLAIADATTLLSLAGQDGSGDLSGTIGLAVGNGGTPVADLDLTSNALTLTRDGSETALRGARIQLRATDYLAAPRAAGTVAAASFASGGLTVERLDATLEEINDATALNASARINDVPTELSGDLAFTQAGTVIELRRLDAAIPDAPLSLAAPATVTLGSLRTTLSEIRLNAGPGSLTLSGSAGDQLDLDLALDRFPLAIANPFVAGLDASGSASGTVAVGGLAAAPDLDFDLSADAIATSQTRAANLDAIDATLAGQYRDGTATLSAARVDLGTGSVEATGTVGRSLDLDLNITDLPVALANGFVDGLGAEGTINGTAQATGSLENPAVTFDLAGRGITATEIRRAGVEPVSLDLAGLYRGGTAQLDRALLTAGTGRIEATGSVGRALDLQLQVVDLPLALANGLRPGLDARGVLNGRATATGSIADPQATFELAGNNLSAAPLRQAGVETVTLDVAGAYEQGTARFDRARVDTGTGSLELTGTAGRALDLRLVLDRLPVALANAVQPSLDARGTLSGNLAATGTLQAPNATFDLQATDVSVAQTRAAGAPAIDATAAGTFANGSVQLQTARVELGTGSVTANGTVGQRLDLNVTFDNVPASLAAAAASGIDPQGTLNGTARATGTLSAPRADYDLRLSGFSVTQTREAGVGPLDIAARGAFADNRVSVDSSLSGSGLAFTANGSVGVSGTPTFDLALNGTAPLSLANRILAEGGRSVQGTVAVDARVQGSAAAPNVTGTISTQGASFVDTGANLALNNINAQVALNGQTATLTSVTAQLGAGGTVSVAGTIGLTPGFPADLRIQVADGRYADGELVTVRLDAGLTLTGPLTGDALLAGTVDAREIAILVPDNLPSSVAQIDLKRRNTPPAVLQQIREIDPQGSGGEGGASGGIRLDLTLNAPNRVFVRGRGLDLELGGTIRITGPVSNLGIAGAFELQRGRFQLLSRRLDFQRATLTFDGNLVPTLDLLAASDTGEVTVYIAITGPANDPAFNFTSSPALPQDEVLARLIFGQGTSDLSPLQIAQLASAAAQLSGVGGGSTGLLENLRSQLGVDDIDIRTTADGQAAVGVGRYLNENTYVGVDSTGRVSIDLELGADIKARAAVTANGGGEVGVFYEKEY